MPRHGPVAQHCRPTTASPGTLKPALATSEQPDRPTHCSLPVSPGCHYGLRARVLTSDFSSASQCPLRLPCDNGPCPILNSPANGTIIRKVPPHKHKSRLSKCVHRWHVLI